MLTDARKSVKRRGRGPGKSSSYLVCGLHPVEAFLNARPEAVERLLCTRELRSQVIEKARDSGVPVERSDARTLADLGGGAAHHAPRRGAT